MLRMHLVSLFILFYLPFIIKCFATKSYNKNAVHDCSSLFCSYDKLTNIYENSKFILAELENILYDVRDERNLNKSEHEYNKKLDLEIKFSTNEDYEDLSHISSDKEYENESRYREPVPYITISRMDEDDFENSVLNDYASNSENAVNRPLTNEEEMDIVFSRIRELEEQQKRFKEENRKYNLKRYLR
ncbi:conserved Plasmodium protein, unknown function [Plasmodium malariae]|uniref:Fam-b protein n=1 Tax=Plasmodium malariae TaxID=5858 RepID=A0A1C3L2X6_PLAMA|nr:conserved Plasmodium protein, unknown function [Plasmodium malariae]